MTGLTTWVNRLAFSPDGATIASAADGGLQLWDLVSGRPRGEPLVDTDTRVFDVAFSPDGMALAAATESTPVYSRLDDAAMVSAACRVVDRELTPTEWDKYLGSDTPYRDTCP